MFNSMFRSATFKLTGWYLAILMAISLIFSVVIYQINYHEIDVRLQNFQQTLIEVAPNLYYKGTISPDLTVPRTLQVAEAAQQLFWALVWANVAVLILGGLGSYFFARRTLRPIEESHEAQSRFTSDASHELRTPLSAMKMELELGLRDPNLSKDESREILESSLEEVNKLIQISETLLKIARLNYDDLERERIDMVAVLEEALKQHRRIRKRFDIKSRKTAYITANKPGILEVMTILIDNALKYSPKNSYITIRIYERLGSVGFDITNKGDVIPAANLSKLFDRFYRADTSRTKGNENGYGLGLSIAKRIIDVHHGDIQVKSTKRGTTFTFSLPLITKKPTSSKTMDEGKLTTK